MVKTRDKGEPADLRQERRAQLTAGPSGVGQDVVPVRVGRFGVEYGHLMVAQDIDEPVVREDQLRHFTRVGSQHDKVAQIEDVPDRLPVLQAAEELREGIQVGMDVRDNGHSFHRVRHAPCL